MQRGRQLCVQVALGTGQQMWTEALVGRGSSRLQGWRWEGWEGFLGLVGAQLLLSFFFWNHHIFPCPPPPNFLGAGELFHLEQVVSLLEGFRETPASPQQSSLPSFLSSLPLSLASYFTPCLFTVVLSPFFPFFPSLKACCDCCCCV